MRPFGNTCNACLGLLALAAMAHAQEAQPYARLADEVEKELRAELKLFYPRTIDQNGGFHVEFGEDWSALPEKSRTTVSQARMTWTAAEVALRRPDLREEYLKYVRHGVTYLRKIMWDSQFGGFYWAVDRATGEPEDQGSKHLYGNSFGIYGCATAYRATQDPAALDLARRAFAWLEEHAHDREHGGYLEAYQRNGTPLWQRPTPEAKWDAIGTLYGYKSMNAHIHILEAYTELYRIWPDDLLRVRVEELISLIRDRMFVEPGCLGMFYTRDWKATPGADSFGHDVETTFLLDEAETAIGRRQTRTAEVGRKLVDHALEFGWDAKFGGLYFEGTAFNGPIDTRKEWWTQAENANTLLLMAEQYPQSRYFEYFQKQWRFITDYQVDHRHGGWRSTVRADGTFKPGLPKANVWKLAYHNCRAMLNVADRLKAMADASAQEKSR